MKVLMLEHYQQTGLHLQPQQQAEVDNELGAWLIEHRKAVAVVEAEIPAIHYGGQTSEELKPRNDEEIYAKFVEESEPHPVDEPVEEEKPAPKPRGKRTK